MNFLNRKDNSDVVSENQLNTITEERIIGLFTVAELKGLLFFYDFSVLNLNTYISGSTGHRKMGLSVM